MGYGDEPMAFFLKPGVRCRLVLNNRAGDLQMHHRYTLQFLLAMSCCWFVSSPVAVAQPEPAAPPHQPESDAQEPSKRMTQRLYELYHYYFWENHREQAFENADYSEQYIKDAEAVVDQFCRHLSAGWNNKFLKNPNPPLPGRA